MSISRTLEQLRRSLAGGPGDWLPCPFCGGQFRAGAGCITVEHLAPACAVFRDPTTDALDFVTLVRQATERQGRN